jgi:hypothetical protein
MVAKLLKDSLEDNVLTLLCWDFEKAPVIALQLTAELFSTREYQRIGQFALDHVSRYGVPPRVHLYDYMEQEIRRRDGDFLRQIIKAMDTLHPELQGRFVQDDLDLFIRRRKMALSLDTAYRLLDQNDLDGARDALYAASAIDKPPQGVWLHDTTKWLSFLDRQEGVEFSSGIDLLDEEGVHPDRGELYLHMGPRKSGKTWALIQIGRRAVEMRHDVLHITLENSSAITRERYTQAFLQLTREQARTLHVPIFSLDSGRLRLAIAEFDAPGTISDKGAGGLAVAITPYQYTGKPGSPGRLLVHEFPTGTLSVPQIGNLLDHLERSDGFKPDIVILDYLNLMEIGDVRQHRLSLGRVGVALRGIAMTRHIAVVTATQTNRASVKAHIVTGTHVAEDWSILGTADTVVTYSQTAQEHDLNLGRIYVDAARNAKDKWSALISQSYATGQFCINSHRMTKRAEEEIERLQRERGGFGDGEESEEAVIRSRAWTE